jgi:hypothetical protein
LGTISCCETLAYFEYTPVKAKIKIITNTHFCVICNIDHTAMLTNYCFCTANMLSQQIVKVKKPPSISNTGMFLAFNLILLTAKSIGEARITTGYRLGSDFESQ